MQKKHLVYVVNLWSIHNPFTIAFITFYIFSCNEFDRENLELLVFNLHRQNLNCPIIPPVLQYPK